MIYRIKEVCDEKGIKVNSIAESVGISLPALYNIVNGKMSPKMETLEKIAAALEVPMWQLFASLEEVQSNKGGASLSCPHCGKSITIKAE